MLHTSEEKMISTDKREPAAVLLTESMIVVCYGSKMSFSNYLFLGAILPAALQMHLLLMKIYDSPKIVTTI